MANKQTKTEKFLCRTKQFKCAVILAGTTQNELAEHLGITKFTLSEYVNQKKYIPEKYHAGICEHLKVHRQEVIELVKEL